jgi:hypothetical protein
MEGGQSDAEAGRTAFHEGIHQAEPGMDETVVEQWTSWCRNPSGAPPAIPTDPCPDGAEEDGEGGCIESDVAENPEEWECETNEVLVLWGYFLWDSTMGEWYLSHTWESCEIIYN